jgi:hypothetical protein
MNMSRFSLKVEKPLDDVTIFSGYPGRFRSEKATTERGPQECETSLANVSGCGTTAEADVKAPDRLRPKQQLSANSRFKKTV